MIERYGKVKKKEMEKRGIKNRKRLKSEKWKRKKDEKMIKEKVRNKEEKERKNEEKKETKKRRRWKTKNNVKFFKWIGGKRVQKRKIKKEK